MSDPAPLVLATDLDGTFAGGTPAARRELQARLAAHPSARLVYVTGRTPAAAAELVRDTALPEPDVLIGDVGTSVLRGLGPERVDAVERALERRWPGADAVRERLAGVDGIDEQEVEAPRRLSFWIVENRALRSDGAAFGARAADDPSLAPDAARRAEAVGDEVRSRLEGLGVDVLVSANVYLDVLPGGVNKGTTLLRVLEWLGAERDTCVVAGDSLNDLALFETGMRGIVVGNCEPALRERVRRMPAVYVAAGEGAAGIVEGLTSIGVLATPRGEGPGTDTGTG